VVAELVVAALHEVAVTDARLEVVAALAELDVGRELAPVANAPGPGLDARLW
jgi:hypothetical protein